MFLPRMHDVRTCVFLLALISILLIGICTGPRGSGHDIEKLKAFHRRDSVEVPHDPDSISLLNISSPLVRRQDYSCGPGRPCSNGACCGKSGFCGYGATYCGSGCVSNCNAVAECGQNAKPAGKKCPLNTCCSEFGFCGTTKDFCTGKCQSNCVVNPAPPGGSAKGQALRRVIGYYESWSYRSKCNNKKPSDMPLSELTHLNYAFAFISPGSYELIPMDDKTPESLFRLTTNVKKHNPSLKVYIAVGGWTFSDNGTVTQPLLGEISSTEANRQKFSDNVVRFLDRHGFDGIDIDWEYPGAPDRGGKPQDTENFTKLMKTLRQTFNASPRYLGITFTIPSSYWYLRWFDMPGLLKYADWTNLMSYDLHGTWDRNNPIGAIAQAHTNLTEIKLAAELLWRVGVRPDQVAIGFGFYGRSFELTDPSCTKPGCPFRGGARPGPCSDTSGVLMHYEIQAILKQVPGVKPVHDTAAAVKYIVWDKNQWVSYDDKDTFQVKLAWANSVGFSGSLIWAVDTDDDRFSAISGLLGKSVAHADLSIADRSLSFTEINVAGLLNEESGKSCKVFTSLPCQGRLACPSGPNNYRLVGNDRDGCPDSPLKKCSWRGSEPNCNGQCRSNEVMIARSDWGGFGSSLAGRDEERCIIGLKVLCCEAPTRKTTLSGCRLTSCGGTCDAGNEKELSQVKCPKSYKRYCCPKDSPLYDCRTRGTTPAAIAPRQTPTPTPSVKGRCDADEVEIPSGNDRLSSQGAQVLDFRGPKTSLLGIPNAFWTNAWQSENAGLGGQSPEQYVSRHLGSTSQPKSLVLLEAPIHTIKDRLERYMQPISDANFKKYVARAVGGEQAAVDSFFAPLRQTIGVFEYLQDQTIAAHMQDIVKNVANALGEVGREFPEAAGLADIWREAHSHYFEQVSAHARALMNRRISELRASFESTTLPYRDGVLDELDRMQESVPYLRYPWEQGGNSLNGNDADAGQSSGTDPNAGQGSGNGLRKLVVA
ncbi:bacteriodes thetaiotaomicron symbiotic chitinase [Colletotrichum karsti]|uniref:chitinase n=1 Tax=Colletotrichum karsti TaxID=1095194 RepID=A0A9P6I352_9PEZI|nr:bacteriodes thetaiotaomicron symbiotic chitinase [Colletotrichum karsti]KAF9874970.1 bacteriodes thetaiotaomicron symbiotic chitinase [Colletotrichum karsti]